MSAGFEVVREGVTLTLEPQDEGGFEIELSRGGHTVRGLGGDTLLEDPAALATIVDGIYADLLSAEHQHS